MGEDSLFGNLDDFSWWRKEWRGMPEFNQGDATPWQTIEVHFKDYFDKDGHWIKDRAIKVHFEDEEDLALFKATFGVKGLTHETRYLQLESLERFIELAQQTITDKTMFIWFPKLSYLKPMNFIFLDEGMQPRYPIYIISKGRWENRLTIKALDKINVPYKVVIEPQEYDNYAQVIDKEKILVLPFSNLGQGSIPARNWVWEHSISLGAKRHWIFDDNIQAFYRLNNNKRLHVAGGTIFRCAEDFVDRYENVGIAGLNYMGLVESRAKIPPFRLNTRIYSMILLDNSLPHRWRGRYNEDTDLSLRILKDGLCSILFNIFMGDKVATMRMKGGNTDELYQGDGRLKMAQSLMEQHPDIVKIVWKWDRWQHQVNYDIFKQNKLKPKEGLAIPNKVDNYGMVLVRTKGRENEIN